MRNRRVILLCVLLGAITLGLYWSVTSFDFLNFDDDDYVTQNTHVLSGVSWKNVVWAFQGGYASNWHPLTWISHMLDCQFYGTNPAGHHFTNILLHSLNAMLLFMVLWRMTGATWRSWLVAALFAWHPAHVESVAWVAERKDVLSTFFGLLTLLSYTAYVHRSKVKNQKSKIYYCLALLCFAFSLMSKPMLVTLPFVLMLLDFWPLNRSAEFGVRSSESFDRPSLAGSPPARSDSSKGSKSHTNAGKSAPNSAFRIPHSVLEKLPFFLLVIFSCVLTIWAQQKGGAYVSMDQLAFNARVANALVAYVKYIGMMFWPAKLCILYLHTGVTPMREVAIAFVLLGAASIAVLKWLRKEPYLAVGWFWFLGTLVPVIGLLQVGEQSMADRYTYFPFIGLFVALTWGASKLWERSRSWQMVVKCAAASALVGCLILTTHQLRFWQSSFTLFTRALQVQPPNVVAYTALADAANKAEKYDEALDYIKKGLSCSKIFPQTHFVQGKIYLHQGKLDEAIASFNEAARLLPGAPEIHQKLGIALLQQERLDEAFTQFSIVTEMAKDPVSECNLGDICSEKKDMAAAIKHYQAALALQPDNVEALNNLAWIRAANENPELRNGAEAVQLAQRACAATQNSAPILLGTLAAAYAEAGQFSNAVSTATQAHDLALAKGLKAVAEKNQELLELYRSGQPYHEGSNTRASSH